MVGANARDARQGARVKTEREEDAEANVFAICLLMPETLIHSELDAMLKKLHPIADEDVIVRRMAKKFAVSEVMMVCRLVQLGRMMPP